MPVLDGIGAISVIRNSQSASKSVLIFGCTADVFKETQERMMGVGADHIIAKPIVESELDDALYRHSQRLYQYHPEGIQSSEKPLNTESLLLEFYVALEDSDLEGASQTLARIHASVPHSLQLQLAELAESIESYLSQAQPPKQEDIDSLTVLLADL